MTRSNLSFALLLALAVANWGADGEPSKRVQAPEPKSELVFLNERVAERGVKPDSPTSEVVAQLEAAVAEFLAPDSPQSKLANGLDTNKLVDLSLNLIEASQSCDDPQVDVLMKVRQTIAEPQEPLRSYAEHLIDNCATKYTATWPRTIEATVGKMKSDMFEQLDLIAARYRELKDQEVAARAHAMRAQQGAQTIHIDESRVELDPKSLSERNKNLKLVPDSLKSDDRLNEFARAIKHVFGGHVDEMKDTFGELFDSTSLKQRLKAYYNNDIAMPCDTLSAKMSSLVWHLERLAGKQQGAKYLHEMQSKNADLEHQLQVARVCGLVRDNKTRIWASLDKMPLN